MAGITGDGPKLTFWHVLSIVCIFIVASHLWQSGIDFIRDYSSPMGKITYESG